MTEHRTHSCPAVGTRGSRLPLKLHSISHTPIKSKTISRSGQRRGITNENSKTPGQCSTVNIYSTQGSLLNTILCTLSSFNLKFSIAVQGYLYTIHPFNKVVLSNCFPLPVDLASIFATCPSSFHLPKRAQHTLVHSTSQFSFHFNPSTNLFVSHSVHKCD